MVHVERAPVANRILTPGTCVLLGFMGAGFAAALYRLIFGLAASTNLNDYYPWGIWVAIDIEGRVALAAGGFTTAALVHIFHRERFEAVVRPAILVALLGYTFAVTGLMLDLGRFYNIWHPAWPTMWQGNSVLFEVAMCVMAYLTVLSIEFAPAVCERFVGRVALPGPLAGFNKLVDGALGLAQTVLGKVLFVFIIAGVVLSCMHQSALGSLILVAPNKTHPLWFTPVLPMLFLMSAIAVGLPMVIFEQIFSAWALGRKIPMQLLTPLSRLAAVFLAVYGFAKMTDMLVRESYGYLAGGGTQTVMFLVELALHIAIPLAMLSFAAVRRSPALLFTAVSFEIVGVALNRINVFLVAYRPPFTNGVYFPSIAEILVTVGLFASMIFLYRLLATVFPVLVRTPRVLREGEVA